MLLPVVLLGALWSLVLVSPVNAGQGPYGPTTTETPPGGDEDPTCEMTVSEGAPGESVDGSVTGAPAGDVLDVYLGGTAVTQVTVQPAAGDEPTFTPFSFTVPQLAPGQYDVVVVGAAFTVTCAFLDGSVGFQVIGEPVVGGVQETPDSDGSGGGGVLPFTGADILILVAVALLAIVAGFVLRHLSGRRADRRTESYW